MATDDFNQIPLPCKEVCGLEQEFVDSHDIVLSRNCKGPELPQDTLRDSTIIRDGEVITYEYDTSESAAGRMACTNRGLQLWLQQRRQAFKAEDA